MRDGRHALAGLAVLATAVAGIAGLPADCSAQNVEVFALIQQMTGDETTGLDMTMTLDDAVVGGFGAGMNIDNFNLNLDMLFGSTEVKSEDLSLDTKLFCFDANLDYSILKGPVSPVVTAGIGSVNFSESLVSYEGFSETDFSYNVGAGLRCTIMNHFLLKALYRATWTTIKETDNAILLSGISVAGGYIF